MSSDSDTAAKIIDLESRLAFQEDALAVLSEQLAKQATTVDLQERKIVQLVESLKQLKRELETAGSPADSAAADQRPPHY